MGDYRNLKWENLGHYTGRQANIYALCYTCRRTSMFDAKELERYFVLRGWATHIGSVYRHLVCSRCRRPAGKIGPSREIATVHPPKIPIIRRKTRPPDVSISTLYFNTRNMLIRDENMGDGSIDQAAIYVREVIRRAIDLGSAALILVHNHPSGSPEPSRQDIDVTRQIIEAGKRLNIAVHDHIIVGAQGHVSMRAKGLL